MTDRIPLDALNSDQLDAVHDERDRLQAQLSDTTRDRDRWKWYRDDAERRVRVQRKRADQAEELLRIAHDTSNKSEAERARAVLRAERAEAERDEARQHAAALAAQRDRLRQRMNTLADRWDQALAVDKPYARTLRAEISCDPFHPDASLVVQRYRADDGSQKWAFRCWGTDTCDGWLSLDHTSQQWAERARDRHVAEEHAAPGPAATQATDGQVCGAYQPPATSADSGLCARCGMFDYRHGSLAEREHHRAEQLAATLAEILLVFAPVSSHNGVCIGWTAPHPIHPDDMARWDTVLNPPKEPTP